MSIETINVRLTSDSSGNASKTISGVTGIIRKVIVKPSATSAPSANWDLLIRDVYGANIFSNTRMSNATALFSTPILEATTATATSAALSTTEQILFPVSGSLTIIGSKMGNTKIADVIILIEV